MLRGMALHRKLNGDKVNSLCLINTVIKRSLRFSKDKIVPVNSDQNSGNGRYTKGVHIHWESDIDGKAHHGGGGHFNDDCSGTAVHCSYTKGEQKTEAHDPNPVGFHQPSGCEYEPTAGHGEVECSVLNLHSALVLMLLGHDNTFDRKHTGNTGKPCDIDIGTEGLNDSIK